MRDGEKKHSSRKVVRLFQKRWVFPTLYIACAAIILTAALWYQASKDPKQLTQKPSAPYSQQNNPSISVASPSEIVKMPAANADQVIVKKKFYDDKAGSKAQEEALVFYNNTYSANTGIDLTAKDSSAFDVTAAVSGTVTKAEKDALLGYVVTIESGNGITTFYQSLSDVKVQVGDEVSQGDVLGKAGVSELNKEEGNHVHFEIRKDNVAVNPESYFDKSIADIKVEQASTEAKDDSKQSSTDAKKQSSDTNASSDTTKTQSSDTNASSDTTKTQSSDTNASSDTTKTQSSEKNTSSDANQTQSTDKSKSSQDDTKSSQSDATSSDAGDSTTP